MVISHKNTRVWCGASIAALLCLAPSPALLAQETASSAVLSSATALKDYNDTGVYDVTWNKLPVGFLVMDAHEDAGTYKVDVVTRATGALKLATKHSSTMNARGIKRNGGYTPQHFETVFKLRGDTRTITLDYDTSGNLVAETNEPPEPEWKRPKVPLELKVNAIDPMTLFYAHRPFIHKAIRSGNREFTLRYYEGRRLTDLYYTVGEVEDVQIGKEKHPLLHVSVLRKPVAGYKEKELKEMREKDMKLQLFLTTDGRYMPLKFVVDAKMGAFYATYKQSCPSVDACVKAMK
ncbi:MAG: DUF3108 domain-containing protein [Alphaproteobacteria bacterium]|nr:DUF3108 domain-containing protein [Alphaproteobacteria bacterium]